MPLEKLCLNYTKVSDLSPLKGMPLKYLGTANNRVVDLSPLKGMPLTRLEANASRITNLSPIRECPLIELKCDLKVECDGEILRAIRTLKTINGKRVADVLLK